MSQSDSQVQRFDPFANRDPSAEEEEYWKNEYPNDETFLKRSSILCSSCGKDVRKAIINDRKLFIHPALQVVICSKCEEFYNDGEFSVDEDGSDKYCRWCGQGGTLYCCSACSVALCRGCVLRNLSRKYIKEIERDDWRCFVCDPKPIWSYRAVCHAAKQYVENYKPSKTSKRSRRNMESDSESDSDLKSTKKRSRRSVHNGKENQIEDESEDSETSHSEKPKRGAKVSKNRNRTSDSDELFSSATTKKRGSKSRSKKSPSPSPKKKASLRSRRGVTNSDDDESSSPSTARTSLRKRRTNVESNVESPSPSRKRNARSKDNAESTKTSSATVKSVSKGRATQSPRKKERNLLELALIDVNNDFRQYSKIVAKMQIDCEVKYLKNKKNNQSPERWQKVKDRYVSVLNDTVESAIVLRDSFLKGLESLEKEDKLTNGDEAPHKSEMNSDVDGDQTADLNNDTANSKGDETVEEETEPKDDIHCEDTVLLDSKKDENEINDTADEMETSTQSEQNAGDAPIEDQSMDERVNDSAVEQDEKMEDSPDEKSAAELSSHNSSTSLEKTCNTENNSKEDVLEDASDSVMDTSQKDESIDTSQKDESIDTSQKDEIVDTPHENESADSTPQKNGHVCETEESDSESKNVEDEDEKDEIRVPEFKDNCSVKLPRMLQPVDLDSSQLSDSERDGVVENESDVSGIDALKSDADEVETV